jgi:hypothetical protein
MTLEASKDQPSKHVRWRIAAALALAVVLGLALLAAKLWLPGSLLVSSALIIGLVVVRQRLKQLAFVLLLIVLSDVGLWNGLRHLALAGGLEHLPGPKTEPYRDLPWADELWDELEDARANTRYVSAVGWRRSDRQGAHVNVENGLRRTHQLPAAKRSGAPRVVFMGGSTVWGLGARDEQTIPSWLSRIAEQRGTALKVENRGELAWTSWQSAIDLAAECSAGNCPEIAIYYGGTNDMTAGALYPDERADLAFSEWEPWMRVRLAKSRPIQSVAMAYCQYSFVCFLHWKLKAPHPFGGSPALDNQEVTRRTVSRLTASKRLFDALATEHGIKVLFVLNAEVSSKQPRSEAEARLLDNAGDPLRWYPWRAELLESLTKILPRHGIVDVTNTFDGHPETIFHDPVHTSEDGNRMVAERIFQEIAPVLKAHSSKRSP